MKQIRREMKKVLGEPRVFTRGWTDTYITNKLIINSKSNPIESKKIQKMDD